MIRAALGAEDTREDVAERTGLTLEQVGVALRYYAEHTDEVDDWLRRVDEEAERAEADWRFQQELEAGW
ncbi:MAG: hypothetical protein OXG52_01185 [bacterium]|nr:hypothetical protein [bacterium]